MATSRPRVGRLAASGDVGGLIDLLGPLDKRDVQARMALISMGADAVPALLTSALFEEPADRDGLTLRAAAACTVLVQIGAPTLRAVENVIRSSDDAHVVAGAAALLHHTALTLEAQVADDLKREVERKTGAAWATVTGDESCR